MYTFHERHLTPAMPTHAVMMAGQRPGAADALGPGPAAPHSEPRILEPMYRRRFRHPPLAWLHQPPVMQRPRHRVAAFQPLLLRLRRLGPSVVAPTRLRPGCPTAAFPPRQGSPLRRVQLPQPQLPVPQRQLRRGPAQPHQLLHAAAHLQLSFPHPQCWLRLLHRCWHGGATPLPLLPSRAHRSCCRLQTPPLPRAA
jgi:hypothetical protein